MRSKILMSAALTAVVAMATGCGSIQHTASVEQETGKPLVAGVGDVMVKVTTRKSLPNLAGKADLFGRTTPTGMTTVVYRGIIDGMANFSRRNIEIETGATTMNSTPIVLQNRAVTNTTGTFGSQQFHAQSVTQGAPTIVAPNTPQPTVMGADGMTIALPLSDLPTTMVVAGMLVRIAKADGMTVSYSISPQN